MIDASVATPYCSCERGSMAQDIIMRQAGNQKHTTVTFHTHVKADVTMNKRAVKADTHACKATDAQSKFMSYKWRK